LTLRAVLVILSASKLCAPLEKTCYRIGIVFISDSDGLRFGKTTPPDRRSVGPKNN